MYGPNAMCSSTNGMKRYGKGTESCSHGLSKQRNCWAAARTLRAG